MNDIQLSVNDIQLYLGVRRSGKTTEMLKWFLEEPIKDKIVVTFSIQHAEILFREAKKQNSNVLRKQFISISQLDQLRSGKYKIGIEELQHILDYFFPHSEIEMITGTLAQEFETHHQYGFVPQMYLQTRYDRELREIA